MDKEYKYPSELFDAEGYPTQEALDYIKNWGYEQNENGEIVYGVLFYQTKVNADKLIEYIKSIWAYKDDAIVYEDGLLELHTLGWSGNEDIVAELKKTVLWLTKHRATQTGGHYFFKIDDNSEFDYWVTKQKK